MKERNSSIELLRIIAMSMVLLTHWNWSMLGARLQHVDFTPVGGARIVFESLVVICVNLFLLITGYYGLKFKLRSFLNIGVLVSSVLILEYVSLKIFVPIVTGKEIIVTLDILKPFCFWTGSDYFVVDYLFLILLSPVLNSFVNAYGKKILPMVISLLLIEFWGDCIMGNQYFGVKDGYSIVHFVIMYLLARCLFLYRTELKDVKRNRWLMAYFLGAAITSVMYVLNIKFTFGYSNPIVVLSSVSFFMYFVTKEFYNKNINWIGSGTFSVYILHLYFPFHYIIKETDIWLFEHESFPIYVLISVPILVTFFLCAVCYDKILAIVRKPILKYCDKIQIKYLSNIDYFSLS